MHNDAVEILELSLTRGCKAEVCVVGPADGHPVLYFHSPATGGEELIEAAPVAEQRGVRLFALRRPSIESDESHEFVELVANAAADAIECLELEGPAILGWSGGAPYALAAAAILGHAVSSIHLVSPVPGPLTGSNAVPNQSKRLTEIANTTATSKWVSGPETLRDYQAIAAPWTFNFQSIARPVTIWSPTDDQIVPTALVRHLAQRLQRAEVIEVSGAHDWLTTNWAQVLNRVAT